VRAGPGGPARTLDDLVGGEDHGKVEPQRDERDGRRGTPVALNDADEPQPSVEMGASTKSRAKITTRVGAPSPGTVEAGADQSSTGPAPLRVGGHRLPTIRPPAPEAGEHRP
jgi:hypothetical protein